MWSIPGFMRTRVVCNFAFPTIERQFEALAARFVAGTR
jgi:hypothetical protein